MQEPQGLSLSQEPVCARGWDQQSPGLQGTICASRLRHNLLSLRGGAPAALQGTWGQRPPAGALPAGNTGGAVQPSGPRAACLHRLRLGRRGRRPQSSDSAPALALALGWGEAASPGNLRPWGACVVVFFSLFHRIQFLGKAHKLRLQVIHTETLIP